MDPVTSLSLGRIVVGVAALASPERVGSTFGVDPTANSQGALLMRLFGAREVTLGATTLLARGSARRDLTLAGVVVDLADAVSTVVAVRDRSVGARAGAMLLLPALTAIASGLSGLRGAR